MNVIRRKTQLALWKARIGGHIYWERLTNPRPKRSVGTLPPSAEALTPEWLSLVLCKAQPDARVTSVVLGAQSAGSTDRRAFKVTYNEAGERAQLPKDLFYKCTKRFASRMILLTANIKENEVGFYGKVRPQLTLEAPKPYFAALDRSSLRLSLILEDIIATRGATFFQTTDRVSRPIIEGQLDVLATYHGKFWNSPSLDRDFTWLFTPGAYAEHLRDAFAMKELGVRGTQRAEGVIPKSLLGRDETVWNAYMASMESCSARPWVYLHGDPHVRNFYRTAGGAVGLVDWGTTMKGSWMYDFPYTLITSLEIEDRRKWDRELLAFYLERLRAHGGQPPSLQEAWDGYRRHAMYAYWAWLVTLGYTTGDTQMQPDDASMAIIARTAQAVEDLGSIALNRQ